MIVLNFASLLTSHNVQAAIRALRLGESWNDRLDHERDEMAWRVRYHPTRYPTFFDDFSQHPRIFEPLPDGSNRRSSAAGALQLTATTWDDICSRYEGVGPEFTPYQQMCAGVALMHMEGALDDVVDGKFDAWLPKLAKRWASLPDSPLQDGGSKRSYAAVRAEYAAWGGTFYEDVYVVPPQTQEPAPIEERGQPARPEDVERINAQEEQEMAPALILGLLGSLMEIFSPVLRAKLTRVLDKTTGDAAISGQVADRVISFAQEAAAQVLPGVVPPPVAPGVPAPAAPSTIDPVIAVGTVKGNAALAAQVEAQVADYLEQLAPVLDRQEKLGAQAWSASEESMDRAAARSSNAGNDDWMAKSLVLGILAASGILILFVGGVAIAQITLLESRTPTTDIWAAITGIIGTVLGILGTVFAYRFGTSRSSSAKDVVISEMSTQRRLRNG